MAHLTGSLAMTLILSCSPSGQLSVPLPPPTTDGTITIERTLATRRSRRQPATRELSHRALGQLLWAAQGVTNDQGNRTAPSAGALYPLELYVALETGWFRYVPAEHSLRRISKKDQRATIGAHVYGSPWLPTAPAIVVFTAVFERTKKKYGERASRYVHFEVGHAAQNLLLQATALGLSSVGIGALDDAMRSALPLPEAHEPLYVIPIGHAAN